jgi:hypothetical protein
MYNNEVRISSLEVDIGILAEELKDLKSKYESLLNRVKCAECRVNNKQDHDPMTDLMA